MEEWNRQLARSIPWVLSLLAFFPGIVRAGVPAPIRMTYPGDTTLVAIEEAYESGDWFLLQSLLQGVLSKLEPRETLKLDLENDYVSVVFVRGSAAGERDLTRVLVHEDLALDSRSTLPGVFNEREVGGWKGRRYYEILLTEHANARFNSDYAFEPQQDEGLGKIGPLLQKHADLAGLLLGSGILSLKEGAPADTVVLHAFVKQVPIPVKRGKISIKSAATLPPSVESRKNATKELEEQILQIEMPAGVDPVRDRVVREFAKRGTALAHVPADSLIKELDASLAGCSNCYSRLRKEWKDVLAVKARFAEIATPRVVKGEAALVNRPRVTWGLGTLAGAVVTNRDRRAKIDGGEVVRDPIKGPLTAALVNVHPVAYAPELTSPSWAERLKTFVAVIVTPDVGAGLGVSFMPFPVRGFSFSGGWGWVRETALRDEYEFSNGSLDSVTDPKSAIHHRMEGTGFVGMQYSF